MTWVQRQDRIGQCGCVIDSYYVNDNGIGVGHWSTIATRSQVIDGDRHDRQAIGVDGWHEGHAVQGRIDIGNRALERHQTVVTAVASIERQAADAVKCQRPVGDRQGHFNVIGARIKIIDHDGVSASDRECLDCVFGGELQPGYRDGWRVVGGCHAHRFRLCGAGAAISVGQYKFDRSGGSARIL